MSQLGPAGAVAVLLAGAAEGSAFFQCGLYNPAAIFTQFRFSTMSMMSLFFGALGTSMISNVILRKMNKDKFDTQRIPTKVSASRVAGGCFLLGVGMASCGAGPTLLPGSLLTVDGAAWTVGGALLGAAAYGLLEKVDVLAVCEKNKKPEEQLLDKKFGFDYDTVSAVAGVAMVGGAFGVSALFPPKNDLAKLGTVFAWPLPPAVAGIIMGLQQLPLRLLSGRGLGASSSVEGIVSTLTGGWLSPKFYFKSLQEASQFIYVYLGTPLGVYLCMKLLEPNMSPKVFAGYGPARQFIGGFLTIFGSRIASGCVCGHGISAFSVFDMSGYIAVPAIFAGGIVSAFTIFA